MSMLEFMQQNEHRFQRTHDLKPTPKLETSALFDAEFTPQDFEKLTAEWRKMHLEGIPTEPTETENADNSGEDG